MKKLIFNTAFLFATITWYSNIYTIHITTIDGQEKSMADFQGKKILIVTLPISKSAKDSIFLRTLDNISRRYADKISVIATPSFEDGYKKSDLNDLKIYYRSILGSQIFLTQGMYTRKSSSLKQEELFSWLTSAAKNEHFNEEVTGAQQVFLINTHGDLYGIIDPGVSVSDKTLKRLIEQNN